MMDERMRVPLRHLVARLLLTADEASVEFIEEVCLQVLEYTAAYEGEDSDTLVAALSATVPVEA